MTYTEAVKVLALINRKLETALQPIRDEVQAFVLALGEHDFGSLKKNQKITRKLQKLLDGVKRRIKCKRCRKHAIIRCQAVKNVPRGVFQFVHKANGVNTTHGGATKFPIDAKLVRHV